MIFSGIFAYISEEILFNALPSQSDRNTLAPQHWTHERKIKILHRFKNAKKALLFLVSLLLCSFSICHLWPLAQSSAVAIVLATLCFQNRAQFSKCGSEVDLGCWISIGHQQYGKQGLHVWGTQLLRRCCWACKFSRRSDLIILLKRFDFWSLLNMTLIVNKLEIQQFMGNWKTGVSRRTGFTFQFNHLLTQVLSLNSRYMNIKDDPQQAASVLYQISRHLHL